jgi:hypothetical protein
VTTDIALIARLVQVSADKDYRQWRRFTNKLRNSPGLDTGTDRRSTKAMNVLDNSRASKKGR